MEKTNWQFWEFLNKSLLSAINQSLKKAQNLSKQSSSQIYFFINWFFPQGVTVLAWVKIYNKRNIHVTVIEVKHTTTFIRQKLWGSIVQYLAYRCQVEPGCPSVCLSALAAGRCRWTGCCPTHQTAIQLNHYCLQVPIGVLKKSRHWWNSSGAVSSGSAFLYTCMLKVNVFDTWQLNTHFYLVILMYNVCK